MTYIDATVTGGNSYLYRVAAFNAGGTSAFVTLATAVAIQAIPAAPTSFTVAAVKANGNNDTATLTWAARRQSDQLHDPACQQPRLHDGPDAPLRLRAPPESLTQTVNRNTVYYYRIRANNSVGDSSAWTNALPFPIRTP